jgi:uncharacterized protein YehS (DUF1456 family)
MAMTKNDILRRLSYVFDYNEAQMTDIFAEGGLVVLPEQLKNWLKSDEDPGFVLCDGKDLESFLNGLINHKRGKKDGPPPKAEAELSNNVVFRKIKIACNLQADQIMEMLAWAEVELSKHELSAFFRATKHKHYRACKDDVLLKFLGGLQHYLSKER